MKNEVSVIKGDPLALDRQMERDPIGAINYFHRLSKEAGKLSTQAAAVAGLLLIKLKDSTKDTFQTLIQNFEFSRTTAYNYIRVAKSIWGNEVDQRAIDFVEMDEKEKVEFLAHDMQLVGAKELRGLYTDLGIMQKSQMGGKRAGAGRKAKEVSYEDRVALANSELSVLISSIEDFRRAHKLAFIESDDVITRSVAVLEEFAKELREKRGA